MNLDEDESGQDWHPIRIREKTKRKYEDYQAQGKSETTRDKGKGEEIRISKP